MIDEQCVVNQATSGTWVARWRTASMPAPAFAYFDTEEQAADFCGLEPEAYRAKWLS